MKARFVSEPVTPSSDWIDSGALSRGEPALPRSFAWRGEALTVADVRRTWRSTIDDRGDTYLARHWFELALDDGRVAVFYFDRQARGRQRWWLYTLAEGGDAPERETPPSPTPGKDPA